MLANVAPAVSREPRAPDEPALPYARWLTDAAVAGWVASLLLPGFVVQSQTEALHGGVILLMGLLFGWAVNGWAVYANLFFPYVIFRLYQKKSAPYAVWMMILLAATIVFFKGVIRDEGSGTILPVVSWGFGAILWGFSLVLAAIASTIYADVLRRGSAIAAVAALGLISAALGVLHVVQRSLANEQEQEIYLSRGMVFTTARFCGIPFTWPKAPLMPPDEMVTLDVDDALKSPGSGAPYLHLPRFVNFQEQGFHWRIYDDPIISSGHVKLRALARPGRFILQARPTDQGAVVRLVNTESGQTLYEQQLRTTSRGRYPRHCPYDTSRWRGLKKGYDTAVLRAVGQEPRESIPSKVLAPEVARSACSLGGADVDGLRGLRAWDGRLVVLYPESVRTRVGFCSDTYIALVYVSIRSPDPMDLSPAVQLFDRKTMEPIASFNDRRPCLRGRCEEAPKAIVKGVRIENNSVVVETDRGDLQASRLLR